MITSFSGIYGFLSNFSQCAVYYEGDCYPSIEHAYQAAKTENRALREPFHKNLYTAVQAKRAGKLLPLRPDWDEVKLDIMRDLIRQKFAPDSRYGKLLLDTEDRGLVEGNYWNDTYWGVCRGVGENHLGKLLMARRKELKEASHL